jgi:hypothetical protein
VRNDNLKISSGVVLAEMCASFSNFVFTPLLWGAFRVEALFVVWEVEWQSWTIWLLLRGENYRFIIGIEQINIF